MARFDDAINFVLAHEVRGWPVDAASIADGMERVRARMPISAWFTDDPIDRGGATAWGITLQAASKYGIKSVEDLVAIKPGMVGAIYRTFWKFDRIECQEVSTKYFDLAINMGMLAATRVVQTALGNVNVDGEFGPKTLEAINSSDPGALLKKIVASAEARYQRIVMQNPSQQRFLRGWIKRARALP